MAADASQQQQQQQHHRDDDINNDITMRLVEPAEQALADELAAIRTAAKRKKRNPSEIRDAIYAIPLPLADANTWKLLTDFTGSTLLHVAADLGDMELCAHLIDSWHIPRDSRTNSGAHAMHYAAMKGHVALVQAFVQRFAVDVNACDANHWTALHFAAYDLHVDTVAMLLDCEGIERNPLNDDGNTPLMLAEENCWGDMAAKDRIVQLFGF